MQYSSVPSVIRRALPCCSLWCNLVYGDHELDFFQTKLNWKIYSRSISNTFQVQMGTYSPILDKILQTKYFWNVHSIGCQFFHSYCFAAWICSYWAAPAVTANTMANTASWWVRDIMGVAVLLNTSIHDCTDLWKFFSQVQSNCSINNQRGKKKSSMLGSWNLWDLQLIFETRAVAIVNYLQLTIKFKKEF